MRNKNINPMDSSPEKAQRVGGLPPRPPRQMGPIAPPIPEPRPEPRPEPSEYQSLHSQSKPKKNKGIVVVETILIVLLVIGLSVTVAIYSSKLTTTKNELTDTEEELNSVKTQLSKTTSERDTLQEQYDTTSSELGIEKSNHTKTTTELEAVKNELNETTQELNTLQKKVTENKMPNASFIPESSSSYQTEEIRFDASGSNDVDGEIIEYKWDFGNGDYASGRVVDYSYENVGEYTVTLTVTDNNNSKDTESMKITVNNAIIISISENSPNYNDGYDIVLTFKNNGHRTATTEEEYWTLITTDGTSYVADDVSYPSPDHVGGGETDEFTLEFDEIDGVPDKLIFNDLPYHQEVELDI